MSKKKKNSKSPAATLLVIWLLFITAIAAFGFLLYRNRDDVMQDLGFTTKFTYTTNSNQDVNSLITVYLKALASADEETLRSCVTTPSQFDNMTAVEGRAKVITDYNNINCYYVDGPEEGSYIVYTIMNITINGVASQPLDIYKPLYVVKTEEGYLIDNGAESAELQDYINRLGTQSDIQDLYRLVKDDQEEKMSEDPSFMEFMNKLNN